ncbi:hypothetical protein rosmuc_01099 [Roseovarius mucosus DSM 17069]|uniref:Uncharacterized protein n=1 Tax=Roseovarius mucosus DSM 17069 TaxID=1288298 RepID=A0A0A0HM73_9RHOB|nr:hypothetical protein rosmuc_01099 [Roseovarius mucosus DSM 17069]
MAPRKGRGHGHDRGVVVADMGQLMRHDGGDFLSAEAAQEAGGGGDGGIGGVAPGGKGIGLIIVEEIDRRARHLRSIRHVMHHLRECYALWTRGRAGVVHAQDHAIGIPPAKGVHGKCHDQRHHRPAHAPQERADAQKERGHRRHQNASAQIAHRISPMFLRQIWRLARRLQVSDGRPCYVKFEAFGVCALNGS